MRSLGWLGTTGVCVLGILAVTMAADPPSKPLTPVEARNKVGQDVVVEMLVRAVKDRLDKRGEIYLDHELDFRSERNFAVVINREGAALFRQQGILDFEEHFRNQTIRAQGRVSEVEGVPRVEVSDPAQVALVKPN